jgi:hypothetical protein
MKTAGFLSTAGCGFLLMMGGCTSDSSPVPQPAATMDTKPQAVAPPEAATKPPAPPVAEAPPGRITRETVEALFKDLKENGPDPAAPLRWSYYFSDPDPKKVEALAARLKQMGYEDVETYQDADAVLNWLRAEKVEPHTPDTLDSRNREFYKLADELGVQTYVGPAAGHINPADDTWEYEDCLE